MKAPFRCDSLAWVCAVQADEVWWVYQGIERPRRAVQQPSRYMSGHSTYLPYLARTLIHDERYMERLAQEQVDFWMSEGCYDDEWEDRCRQKAHREGNCPCCPDQLATYEAEVKTRLKDEAKKRQWLSEDCFDWEMIQDDIRAMCEDDDSLLAFLKEHPIIGAMVPLYGDNTYDYLNLEDVVGHCPSCNQPVGAECVEGNDLNCRSCNAEVEGVYDPEVLAVENRPFNWPAGAPYPPRRHFDGSPLDVPFYEE